MIVLVEISYDPLVGDFIVPVKTFIQKLVSNDIIIETGKMSTIITGDYNEVMNLLTKTIGELMNMYPSVFNIKI